MSSIQIVDRLGSAALTIAVLSLLLLFVPRLVRADCVDGHVALDEQAQAIASMEVAHTLH